MSDKLAEIVAVKREHVARAKRERSQADIERAAKAAAAPRGFAAALERAAAEGRFGLITEMKRRSPSGGEIRPGFDPAQVAHDYEAAGATCLSVLTDEPYFGGRDEDIAAARGAAALPVLRKDFMIDLYQIAESRAIGADCILLIVAALDDATLHDLNAEARRWGLDILVEAHDQAELDRGLALDAKLIGINNRNLKTLRTDLATFESLAPRVPDDRLAIAESGLVTHADLRRMARAGARGFLIGESLLRQPDLRAATRALLSGG
jgi:indole-3-glycerol phosphate synthase